MVVLLDPDDKGSDASFRFHSNFISKPAVSSERSLSTTAPTTSSSSNQEGPGTRQSRSNADHLLSRALACYPVVSQLGSFLDQNDLDHLSQACRQFRSNLFQYRSYLLRNSLRCSFEPRSRHENSALYTNGTREVWVSFGCGTQFNASRWPARRAIACARDLVSECRKCGVVICRNCIQKPPPTPQLPKRHRRLCSICASAPLARLTDPVSSSPPPFIDEDAFTSSAFSRNPCKCPDMFFLCRGCAHNLSGMDAHYRGGWMWRKSYSDGGLGTGIGEGNEGVPCGRGAQCLAAEEKEVEVECGSDRLPLDLVPPGAALVSPLETPKAVGEGEGEVLWGSGGEEKAGYLRQEIEGIGGIVKKKFKMRVRIGRTVREYEEERREKGRFLEREGRGERRSWCGWCGRVIRGEEDGGG